MFVVYISSEEVFGYVMTLGGSVAGESRGLVWRVTEQMGGKWRVR